MNSQPENTFSRIWYLVRHREKICTLLNRIPSPALPFEHGHDTEYLDDISESDILVLKLAMPTDLLIYRRDLKDDFYRPI